MTIKNNIAYCSLYNIRAYGEGLTGKWRKLHNREFLNLYSASNIIRVIRTRRMRWVGHVVRMGRGNVHANEEIKIDRGTVLSISEDHCRSH
jgi:hypothetical protein